MGLVRVLCVCKDGVEGRGTDVRLVDGMYANFAGRDASRGMAKQSFDEGALVVPHSDVEED